MPDEAHVDEAELDPRVVLITMRSASTRMALPLGAMHVECLVLLYAGVRPALGACAVPERVAVAVPDENIVDVLENLIAGARRLFPELAGGSGRGCKDMVALVGAGVLAEHTSNPELGGSGGRCDWSGVGVVDDRADSMAPEDDPADRPMPRPWRRR